MEGGQGGVRRVLCGGNLRWLDGQRAAAHGGALGHSHAHDNTEVQAAAEPAAAKLQLRARDKVAGCVGDAADCSAAVGCDEGSANAVQQRVAVGEEKEVEGG